MIALSFSRRLALVGGILVPLGETIRRWSTWREYPPTLFDDYIAGALLLYGAWRSTRDVREGQRFLVAAWAFACAMAYMSFFGHIKNLHAPDPAPIPHVWVVTIIGLCFALSVLALLASLQRLPYSIDKRFL
jgi:hypothetical protein